MDAGYYESLIQGLESSIDQLNERPLNLGELLRPQMKARHQFAEPVYDKFLSKVAQRSIDLLESRDPEPRSRREPQARSELAAYGTDGSRMEDIFGTGGEDTDRSQALMAPIRTQPTPKRRGARRPLSGNIASTAASAVEKLVREWSRDSGSDEDRQGEFSDDDEECAALSNNPASEPGKQRTPFLERKGKRRAKQPTPAPGAATSTASAASTTTTSPSPTQRKESERTYSTSSRQWSEPRADKSEIKQTLNEHCIWFYFAYGMKCPHKPCRCRHGQATLPFGYNIGVCRNNPAWSAFEAMTDLNNAYPITMPSFK